MKLYNLKTMVKGWIVGNFEPSVLQSEDVEVAVKHYAQGDDEPNHTHLIADEITVIVTGAVTMNGQLYTAGDIIHIEPGESTDFKTLRDTTTVVIKLPSVMGDKYTDEQLPETQDDFFKEVDRIRDEANERRD